jgi:hypothetical protein
MKTLARRVWLAGGLALLTGVCPASAQIYQEMTFKTTFPFMVGSKLLPAGTYTVSPAFDGAASLLEIRGGGRHAALFFGVNAGKPQVDPNQSAALFNRSGDHYVLTEIWDASDREGTDMIPAHGAALEKNEQSKVMPMEVTHTARK